MSKQLRILNEFGITPTNNYVSAGADFYVPYFDVDKMEVAFNAFMQSYKVDNITISNIKKAIAFYTNVFHSKDLSERDLINLVHLYLALDSAAINSYEDNIPDAVKLFCQRYLIFDKNGKPGIALELNDALLINSGIHVALDPGTAGIFFNKSGKGNAGFDVRAQVVDEDYTGFVHLSVAYTKDCDSSKRYVFCGDKLSQMIILPVIHSDYVEIDSEEYYTLMQNSNRGSNALGSSDVQH